MSVVVDASVALKWVIEEDGTREAEALARTDDLLAPDFLLLECANVLAMMCRRNQLAQADAAAALEALRNMPLGIFPSSDLVARAQALAIELGQSAYDCLYLQLALAENVVLVTADQRFRAAVIAHGAYAPAVRSLL